MKEKNIAVLKSPRYNPERQCRFKYRYKLKRRAIKDAQVLTKDTGFIYSVYECPHCGKYHVGKVREE